MIESSPKFVQGIYAFSGSGYDQPVPLAGVASYVVPSDKRAQPIYFRGGNSSSEMIAVMLMCGGRMIRIFPIGAKDGVHVPLAVVEDVEPDQTVELRLVAPAGTTGTVIVDLGLMEI